jgi:hypothetical protein
MVNFAHHTRVIFVTQSAVLDAWLKITERRTRRSSSVTVAAVSSRPSLPHASRSVLFNS